MRATIRNYMDAVKRRREEGDEAGFSLIELIVVVVILGILAAIAIPVFNGLQDQAKKSALESIVGNAASQVASDIAREKPDEIDGHLAKLVAQSEKQVDGISLTNSGTDIDKYCVTGKATGLDAVTSGPGCSAPTTP